MFSSEPRCHGLCGSQKVDREIRRDLELLVARHLCAAVQVSDRRSSAGKRWTCFGIAFVTVTLSRDATRTSMVKRDARSTSVAMQSF